MAHLKHGGKWGYTSGVRNGNKTAGSAVGPNPSKIVKVSVSNDRSKMTKSPVGVSPISIANIAVSKKKVVTKDSKDNIKKDQLGAMTTLINIAKSTVDKGKNFIDGLFTNKSETEYTYDTSYDKNGVGITTIRK